MFALTRCKVLAGISEVVGRIAGKVKEAWLSNVEFEDFGQFVRSFEEERGRCARLEFVGSTARKNRKDILEMKERMGWRVEKDTDNEIIIVN